MKKIVRITCPSLMSLLSVASAMAAPAQRFDITRAGAVADGKTVNTQAIQKAIDAAAEKGGGTVVVPRGTFVSGALFLKPKVNLLLEKDAVIQCSTDLSNFPPQRTRIEGHFEDNFTPALINADGCDDLTISGEGTLDGAGKPIWDQFWKSIKANKKFRNLDLPRARLALVSNSQNVLIDGITFKDSQFWNLHLYKSRHVTVKNARFLVPDDYKQAPSTDGIDVDSCQDVTIESCYFSVTDDCIAMKGSKGPHALEDKDSPPVERVRISNCTFKRGGAALTLGSEATIVRDIVISESKIIGNVNLLHFKLRPDTPQHYEDIHYRNITLDSPVGKLIHINPWKQYFDLKGEAPPKSTVRNITLTNINGRFGSFGNISGNKGQTTISHITLKDIDLELGDAKPKAVQATDLKAENVTINGKTFSF